MGKDSAAPTSHLSTFWVWGDSKENLALEELKEWSEAGERERGAPEEPASSWGEKTGGQCEGLVWTSGEGMARASLRVTSLGWSHGYSW